MKIGHLPIPQQPLSPSFFLQVYGNDGVDSDTRLANTGLLGSIPNFPKRVLVRAELVGMSRCCQKVQFLLIAIISVVKDSLTTQEK